MQTFPWLSLSIWIPIICLSMALAACSLYWHDPTPPGDPISGSGPAPDASKVLPDARVIDDADSPDGCHGDGGLPDACSNGTCGYPDAQVLDGGCCGLPDANGTH